VIAGEHICQVEERLCVRNEEGKVAQGGQLRLMTGVVHRDTLWGGTWSSKVVAGGERGGGGDKDEAVS